MTDGDGAAGEFDTNAARTAAGDTFDRYALEHPQFGSTTRTTTVLAEALDRCNRLAPIIDVGCGEGGTLEALASADRLAIGFELSRVRARMARDRGYAVVVADGVALPCRSGSVGLAISRHVIEHIPDVQVALTELRRAVGSGGGVYVETPLRLRGAWYFYRNQAGRRVLDPTHVREYETTEQLRLDVEAAGITVIRVATARIRFPAGELMARVARKMARRLEVPRRILRSTVGIPVPRYREIRLLGEITETNQPTRALSSWDAVVGSPCRTAW